MTRIKEEQVGKYWVLSRQWRGDPRFGAINTGEMLQRLADLGGSTNNTGWQRLEGHVANLLQQVINNKRNRKRSSANNVVLFSRAPRPIAVALESGSKGDTIQVELLQAQG